MAKYKDLEIKATYLKDEEVEMLEDFKKLWSCGASAALKRLLRDRWQSTDFSAIREPKKEIGSSSLIAAKVVSFWVPDDKDPPMGFTAIQDCLVDGVEGKIYEGCIS